MTERASGESERAGMERATLERTQTEWEVILHQTQIRAELEIARRDRALAAAEAAIREAQRIARHPHSCGTQDYGDCTCGLAEWLALPAVQRAREPRP